MDVEFLATCWTSAGDVAPLTGDETSPFAIEDRIREIARTGWSGLSLGQDDLKAIRQSIGFEALRDLIDGNNLKYTEVELLSGWQDDSALRQGGAELRDLLFEAAEELNARQVKIAAFGEPLDDISPIVQPLIRLCDVAESRNVRIALEPMPFGLVSSVPKIAELLSRVDRPRTFGIFIDSWQFFRAENTLGDLKEQIGVENIFGVELNDASPQVHGTLIEDTINHRLPPGDGSFDLIGFVSTLSEMGWRGPWGVEIMSRSHRKLSLEDALTVAHESAHRVLVEALS